MPVESQRSARNVHEPGLGSVAGRAAREVSMSEDDSAHRLVAARRLLEEALAIGFWSEDNSYCYGCPDGKARWVSAASASRAADDSAHHMECLARRINNFLLQGGAPSVE